MNPVQRFRSVAAATFLLTATAAFAQSFQKQSPPPGTTPVAHFYIDKQEITNLDYREYLYWLALVFGQDAAEYKQALPDTTVWRNSLNYAEPLVNQYFRHPAYENYPVVGVSFEQAQQYCSWRTDRVYEMKLIEAGLIPVDRQPSKDNYFTVERYLSGQFMGLKPDKTISVPRYRLPTKDEWELAASGRLDASVFPYGYDLSDKKIAAKLRKGQQVFQSRQVVKMQNKAASPITAPARSGFANGHELYNMIGNVAEMTAERGRCKGGSFQHTLEESKIADQITYTQPEAWLGFRCVCVPEMPR